jgi:hypothetical protein
MNKHRDCLCEGKFRAYVQQNVALPNKQLAASTTFDLAGDAMRNTTPQYAALHGLQLIACLKWQFLVYVAYVHSIRAGAHKLKCIGQALLHSGQQTPDHAETHTCCT